MNRLLYIFLCLISVLLFCKSTLAKSTDEMVINKNFRILADVVHNKSFAQYSNAIDLSIEIIKSSPRSLEAGLTVSLLSNFINYKKYKYIKEKYKELKDKYFSTIENFDTDIPEKMILAYMFFRGVNSDDLSEKDREKNSELGEKILVKMKDSCKDQNLKAIALWMISSKLKYCYEFKEKYPQHPFMPFVEISLAGKYLSTLEYDKYIEEISKLNTKYGDIDSPLGYKVHIAYYSEFILTYVAMNNYSAAKSYLDTIEKELPTYWGLNFLKNEVQNIKGKQ